MDGTFTLPSQWSPEWAEQTFGRKRRWVLWALRRRFGDNQYNDAALAGFLGFQHHGNASRDIAQVEEQITKFRETGYASGGAKQGLQLLAELDVPAIAQFAEREHSRWNEWRHTRRHFIEERKAANEKMDSDDKKAYRQSIFSTLEAAGFIPAKLFTGRPMNSAMWLALDGRGFETRDLIEWGLPPYSIVRVDNDPRAVVIGHEANGKLGVPCITGELVSALPIIVRMGGVSVLHLDTCHEPDTWNALLSLMGGTPGLLKPPYIVILTFINGRRTKAPRLNYDLLPDKLKRKGQELERRVAWAAAHFIGERWTIKDVLGVGKYVNRAYETEGQIRAGHTPMAWGMFQLAKAGEWERGYEHIIAKAAVLRSHK